MWNNGELVISIVRSTVKQQYDNLIRSNFRDLYLSQKRLQGRLLEGSDAHKRAELVKAT